MLGGLAVLVGLATGFGVWLFKRLIDLAHWVFFDQIGAALARLGPWTVLFVPALGGLVVGLTVHFLIGEERHHGVAGVMEATALGGGRLRYRRIPAKAAAAALSIGSGASVGPEDPSVQIGANVGSMLGQWFRLSDERMRALVAAGAAGGIAAAFNAPIAAVFFALEIVLGELSGGALGIVVLAAVVSAVFTQAVSGAEPAFHVPPYAFNSAWELPLYLGLGLVAGPVSALYIRVLYAARAFFARVPLPRWGRPVAAGLVMGLAGLFLPQLFGVGYDTISTILSGAPVALALLLALAAGKLLLTTLCLGGGFQGGVFAPSLFLGAALGGAYGLIAQRLFPGLAIAPPAFAMVGMAAVLAGTVHAPLTAIILLFEMTNDYRIILPLMFAVMVSLVLARALVRFSVYGLGLERKGVHLERGRDVRVLEGITVGEVMRPPGDSLHETDSVQAAADTLLKTHHHGMTVVNAQGQLVGILTLQDIDRIHTDGHNGSQTVGDICTRDLEVAYPDETMDLALRRMGVHDIGRMPVVDRNDPQRLLGVLRRTDIVRAYDMALTRRAVNRHRAQQIRLGAYSGVNVEELHIEPGAPCAGKPVKALPWPHDSILVTLRRGRQVMIPHGDTVLQPGDVLVVAAEGEAREELRRLTRAPHKDGAGPS